ncbi:MAG: CPBP family intramembrane glutamic endopeptidase, partial [Ilumatobacter sp.]|uniref:CPBP family intramembrane glutamic endopeptidase n=1 Tax=Ilumatobacter sp. TaxID=1967498 RepID=UPI0032986D30
MTTERVSATASDADCPIPARAGLIGFVGTWLCASVASSLPLVAFVDPDDTVPIPVLAASLLAGWITFLVGVTLTSRTNGSGDVASDLGITARPIDLVGIPIGIVAQVAVVPLVYVPLRAAWPATFDDEALTDTAKDLVDRADGILLPLLFVLVAFGAPLVEEIVYRALLQRPLLRRYPTPAVIVGVAAVFALIHFRPVEYPGLFVAGLVFGVCAWRTGRVGL